MLEESHLQPTVRKDRDRLALILHESFMEIGASGRLHTLRDVLDHLPDEDTSLRTLEDFVAQMLSDDIALTTYTVARTDQSDERVHRSRRSGNCGSIRGHPFRPVCAPIITHGSKQNIQLHS